MATGGQKLPPALFILFSVFGCFTVGFPQAPCSLKGTVPKHFSKTQEPLSLMRERTGGGKFRTQAGGQFEISSAERLLLSEMQEATLRGDWQTVKTLFARYTGRAVAIYTTVMNAAFRCGQYRFGVDTYQRFCEFGLEKDPPVYTMAIKLFSKVGEAERVREIWREAQSACELNEALAAARIDAAADAGDVQGAAGVLDELIRRKNCDPDLGHFTSAIHACARAERPSHNAALFLFDCMTGMGLEPDVAAFSALVGSFRIASLDLLLATYQRMKSLDISPNEVFAEVYLTRLLQIPKAQRKQSPADILKQINALTNDIDDRVQAAEMALAEFHQAGVRLSNLSQIIESALRLLGHSRT